MSVRRVDQGCAAAAAELLPEESVPERKEELSTRYRKLSAMLHGAGLAATYAFVAARTGRRLEKSYQEVADGICRRLTEQGLLTGEPTPRNVLRQLGDMDIVTYARASAEAAALLSWLSRLADATYQRNERASESNP
jgi:CRISPR/Cas system CMR-associated protein Cmr5 small subunit